MIRFFTMTHQKYETIYVDQASRIPFFYLQQSETAKETIKGKESFELYAKKETSQFKPTTLTMVSSKCTGR